MSNRYTDTDKWDDDWFLRLPPKMKCAWNYLCDTCKGVGDKKVSLAKFSNDIGEEISREEFDRHFEGRVFWLSEDTVWIPGTLSRIYKNLSPNIPAHVNAAKKILRITEGLSLTERGRKVRERFELFLSSLNGPAPEQAPAGPQPGLGYKEKRERIKEKDSFEEGAGETFGPRELAAAWNERMAAVKSMAGKPIPLVDRLEPQQERWTMAKARLAEEPSEAVWRDVIDRIARSEFCRGKGSKSDWVANFTFLVRPKTFVAVLEGEYGCTAKLNFTAQRINSEPTERVDARPNDPAERHRIAEAARAKFRQHSGSA